MKRRQENDEAREARRDIDPETVRDLEPREEEAREIAGGSQKCNVKDRPATWAH
jgi:hypothetical protein